MSDKQGLGIQRQHHLPEHSEWVVHQLSQAQRAVKLPKFKAADAGICTLTNAMRPYRNQATYRNKGLEQWRDWFMYKERERNRVDGFSGPGPPRRCILIRPLQLRREKSLCSFVE